MFAPSPAPLPLPTVHRQTPTTNFMICKCTDFFFPFTVTRLRGGQKDESNLEPLQSARKMHLRVAERILALDVFVCACMAMTRVPTGREFTSEEGTKRTIMGECSANYRQCESLQHQCRFADDELRLVLESLIEVMRQGKQHQACQRVPQIGLDRIGVREWL